MPFLLNKGTGYRLCHNNNHDSGNCRIKEYPVQWLVPEVQHIAGSNDGLESDFQYNACTNRYEYEFFPDKKGNV